MDIRFTIIIFFFPVFIKAQLHIDRPPLSLDSLQQVLPLLRNEARVDCLTELARAYCEKMTLSYKDSALEKLDHAYKEASAINYSKGLGDACIEYGMIYTWLVPNYRQCEKYYREAISSYEKVKYDNGSGLGLRGLGIIFFNQGFIDEAQKAFTRSVFYFTRAGNQIMLADLTEWFGTIYGAKGDFEKQFEFIKKGLREKRRINNTRGIVWSFYRFAYLYVGVEDYETALDYFRKSFQQANKESMPWQIYRSMGRVFLYMDNYDSSMYYFKKVLRINPTDAPALAGLGQLFMRKKEYKIALSYLLNALITFKRNIDLGGEIWVTLDIGEAYAELKQYAEALRYSNESLAMARQNNNKAVIERAYEIDWTVYEALKHTDSAYFYYQKFVALKDSLDEARFRRRLLQKLALYKAEVKEEQQLARIDLLNKDNRIKKQQLQKESLMKKVLTGSLIVLVLLSIIILRNIALKRKNETHRRELAENELQIQKLRGERTEAELLQQKTELEMQALRAQMNPHFIFNSLNSINSFILKNQRTEATEYLTKFSRLIRMMLHSSASAAVSLAEDLAALQLYMELESLRFEEKFDFKIECDPDLDPDFIHVPPMLLQPYVENAIWHGLMLKKEKGNLWVNINREGNDLICTVTDNGIGRKKAAEFKSISKDEHKSMGMRITADRIALLHQQNQEKASVRITDLVFPDGSPGGTEVVIKIPVRYD